MYKKLFNVLFNVYKKFIINLKRLLNKSTFKRKFNNSEKLKIIIGAAEKHYKDWISAEKYFFNIILEKDWHKFFSKRLIDALLAEHVWEHLTLEEGKLAAKLCFKYLNEGGYIRLAVPDGLFPDEQYIQRVMTGVDDHKVLYTYKTFTNIFEEAGFQVDLLEYFDEKGNFHFKEWYPVDGMIKRSKRFDPRNQNCLEYTSIIIDAIKPIHKDKE